MFIGHSLHSSIFGHPILLILATPRAVFVGGSRGTSPSLDLTFPPTCLSENVGGMERGRGEREREGWGRPPALLPPPPGFCLKYQPAYCKMMATLE